MNRKEETEETIFVTSRRNYKVCPDVGASLKETQGYTAILNTVAGSSFIRKSNLPLGAEIMITSPPSVSVKHELGKILSIDVQIRLKVKLGTKTELVKFYVAQRLSTVIIISSEFSDKHVKAIRPRAHIVELDDGTTVSIVMKQSARPHDGPPLQERQDFFFRRKHVIPKIQVVNCVVLPAESQTWVQVKKTRVTNISHPNKSNVRESFVPRSYRDFVS